MLSLNALLLRRTATPVTAWTENSLADISLSLWTDGRLEPIALDEADILDAAIPGDVVVSILRRFRGMPTWQEFIKEALNLDSFGPTSAESLGAAIFCAIPPGDTGRTQVRWIAWSFGTASRAIRRSAVDPRFGLLAALNLMVLSFPEIKKGQEIRRSAAAGRNCARFATEQTHLMCSRPDTGPPAIFLLTASEWTALAIWLRQSVELEPIQLSGPRPF